MAALLPSMRTRFSNAGNRSGDSAGGATAAAVAGSAGAAGRSAASRLASRSSSSTTSLRNSPSDVNGRRSMTRNDSSCFLSDKGHSSTMHFDFSLSRVAPFGPLPPYGSAPASSLSKAGRHRRVGRLTEGGSIPRHEEFPQESIKERQEIATPPC